MFRSNPVDLLHSHNTGCEEAPVAARLAGTPRVVGTFHVDPTYDLHGLRSGLRYRLLEHLSNHCLDRGIGVSGDAGRAWMRRTHLPARRVVTIPNGIDAESFRRRTSKATARARLELSSDALVLGGVGRLEEAKGFTYLLDAVAMLAADFPKLMLVVAGRGPLLDDLTRQAGRLGIADRVRFLGFQSDIQGVLDALDVFAMPSLCETLGYALLEAMATELPAVASAVGGIPEVVVANQTGFLAPPRAAGALAAALRPLLASAELRDRFGGAGRERVVRCFREDEMVRRTIMLYRELCVSPRRSSGSRSSAGALA
jgi:glycosyltransferase involved in cell wall biosynthesis